MMELTGLLFQPGKEHLQNWSVASMVADSALRFEQAAAAAVNLLTEGTYEEGTHTRPMVAKKNTIAPTSAASTMEWGRTLRMRSPSRPCSPTAAVATTMDWAAIILPMTPPAEFAAAMSTGGRPSRDAEIT